MRILDDAAILSTPLARSSIYRAAVSTKSFEYNHQTSFMPPMQKESGRPNGCPYHNGHGQYIIPFSTQLAPLEAKGGQRPTKPIQLPKPAHLGGLASTSRRPAETNALSPVSHNLGVQEARIEAKVAQLKKMDGELASWKSGDTTEHTAVRFQVHLGALEKYSKELAKDDKDGKSQRELAILKRSQWEVG